MALPQIPTPEEDPPLPDANNKPSVSATGGLPGQSGIAKQVRQNINPLLQQHITDRLSTRPGELSATTRRELADFEERSKQVRAEEELKLQRLGVLRHAGAPLRALPELTGQLERARLDILARGEERRAQAFQGGLALSGQAAGEIFTEAGLSGDIFGQKTISQQQQDIQNDNAALQRAIDQGNLTGIFIDPITGEEQDTLQARLADAKLVLDASIALGTVDGELTLAARSLAIDDSNAALERAIAQGNATGVFVDPITGESQDTLQKKIAEDQQALAEAAITGVFDGEATLAGQQQTLAKTNAAMDRAIAQGQATGDFTDPETGKKMETIEAELGRARQKLLDRQQDELERAVLIEEALVDLNAKMDRAVAHGQATGSFVDPTSGETQETIQAELGRAQQALEESIRTGELVINQRDVAVRELQAEVNALNAAMSRAFQTGEATGDFTDPVTGETQQTLQAELSRKSATLAQSQLNLQEGIALGRFGDKPTLDKLRLDEAIRAAKAGEVLTGGQLAEIARANLATEGISQNRIDEQERAALAAEALQSGALTGSFTRINPKTGKWETSATLEELRQDFQMMVDIGNATGQLSLEDAQGNIITKETMAAKMLAFEKMQAAGIMDIDPLTGKPSAEAMQTLSARTVTLQENIENGKLALQEQAQEFGQDITEAEITGVYNRMGGQTAAMVAAMDTSALDERYNSDFDFNNDGQINLADWNEFQAIANGDKVTTLSAQSLAAAKTQAEFDRKISEANVTGLFDNVETMAQAQQTFDNRTREAELFGGSPPLTFSQSSLNEATAGGYRKDVDPRYQKQFDINNDGVNDNKDRTAFLNEVEKARNGEESRITLMGGEGLAEVWIYSPPGEQTIAAQQLGIAESTLVDEARRFDLQHAAQISAWKTEFSGYMVDEDGQPEWVWDPDEPQMDELGNPALDIHFQPIFGGWKQPTSIQRSQFDQQKVVFDKAMDETAIQFAIDMGLVKDQAGWDKLHPADRMALTGTMATVIYNSAAARPSFAQPGEPWWKQPLETGGDILSKWLWPD